MQLIDIGIKKPGNPAKVVSAALDPLRVDPNHYKLEFENSQVRVLRVGIGPRQSVPMHEYVLNHVVVYFTEQNSKIENLNDKPFEAAVMELKN